MLIGIVVEMVEVIEWLKDLISTVVEMLEVIEWLIGTVVEWLKWLK